MPLILQGQTRYEEILANPSLLIDFDITQTLPPPDFKDPSAQFELGLLCLKGKGRPQHTQQALHWIKMAAEAAAQLPRLQSS